MSAGLIMIVDGQKHDRKLTYHKGRNASIITAINVQGIVWHEVIYQSTVTASIFCDLGDYFGNGRTIICMKFS